MNGIFNDLHAALVKKNKTMHWLLLYYYYYISFSRLKLANIIVVLLINIFVTAILKFYFIVFNFMLLYFDYSNIIQLWFGKKVN